MRTEKLNERIERTAAALAASHREKAQALLGEGA
jgi:hypothetical protein